MKVSRVRKTIFSRILRDYTRNTLLLLPSVLQLLSLSQDKDSFGDRPLILAKPREARSERKLFKLLKIKGKDIVQP